MDFSLSGAKKKPDEEVSNNKNYGQNERDRFDVKSGDRGKPISRLPDLSHDARRIAVNHRKVRCGDSKRKAD
jgi:hypothetical protein